MSERLILFLRGVNVGSHNRVPMAALREMLAARGLEGARTYLQSGNVVVDAPAGGGAAADLCRRALAEELGLQIVVIARTADELEAVVAENPLAAEAARDPKRLLVSFLGAGVDSGERAGPGAERLRRLEAAASAGERVALHGAEIYSWHPDGVGRSKLWNELSRIGAGRDGVEATARNWATVTALAEMTREG